MAESIIRMFCLNELDKLLHEGIASVLVLVSVLLVYCTWPVFAGGLLAVASVVGVAFNNHH